MEFNAYATWEWQLSQHILCIRVRYSALASIMAWSHCSAPPGRELTSILRALVGCPNAIRPRSPTAYGPWKSQATPFEVAMPIWPMNGKNIVMGGNGDHRMVYARGWRLSDVAVLFAVHATLLALLWWLDDRVAIVSGVCWRCISGFFVFPHGTSSLHGGSLTRLISLK